jgi:glycosyltransferase involved in cell wall biosynthesis
MNSSSPNLKVAIVCDWLTGIGGAERVVLAMHKMYPDAPIYTSQYDPSKIDWFKDADVRTLWVQKLPKSLRKFLVIFRAWSFSHLDLSEYDLVISSSGAEAKGVKTGPNTTHISYIHSPTQYYWIRYNEYLKSPGFGVFDGLARLGLRLLVSPMKKWDHKAAQRADYLIANSSYTRNNIKKFYGRDSTVISPPVDTDRFKPSEKVNKHGFVIAGRQTPYKRVDLAVSACSELNLDLKVIGNGPDHDRLVSIAGPTVTFLNNVSDSEIPKYFQESEAFIFPGIDDFGIVSVEALAAGTPVIAYGVGGVNDYINASNGVLFDEQSTESLSKALKLFNPKKYDNLDISRSVSRFSLKNFCDNLGTYIDGKMVKR